MQSGRKSGVRSLIYLTAAILASAALGQGSIYRYIDVFRDAREDQRGIPVISQSWRDLHNHMKHLQFTKSADEAYDFTNDVVQSVSFDTALRSPIAVRQPDGTRSFLLKGTAKKDAFVIDYEKATIDRAVPQKPFEFAAEFRVREHERPIPEVKRGFGLGAKVKLDSGQINHHTLLRSLTGVMQVFEPRNLPRLPDEATDIDLPPLGRKARGEVLATLPTTIAFIEKYSSVYLNPVIEKHVATGKAYTRIKGRLALNLEHMEKDYPDLADYLDTLLSRFELRVNGHYALPGGPKLIVFGLDSKAQAVNFEFLTADGHVMPMDKDGMPVVSSALRLDTMQHHAGEIVINAGGEVLGLSFKAHDITLSNEYRDGPIMQAGGRMVKLPKPEIEGRALGFIPTWAIDMTIPGSLDGYMQMVTDGLMRGDNGKGTYLHLTMDTRDPDHNKSDTEMGTVLVDNFFINFGLRVAQQFIWPSRAVLRDVKNLGENFAGHIAGDLTRLERLASAVAH